jgi:hypothetical protein
MSFHSLPLVINEIRATEAVLNRIYDATKLGLKGDNLALAEAERRALDVVDVIAHEPSKVLESRS